MTQTEVTLATISAIAAACNANDFSRFRALLTPDVTMPDTTGILNPLHGAGRGGRRDSRNV